MSATETMITSIPLAPATQAGLAERIQTAMQSGEAQIVCGWCSETGFFAACHVIEAGPCFWEISGPVSERQADELATAVQDLNASARVLM